MLRDPDPPPVATTVIFTPTAPQVVVRQRTPYQQTGDGDQAHSVTSKSFATGESD
jgi:hypothetical protein